MKTKLRINVWSSKGYCAIVNKNFPSNFFIKQPPYQAVTFYGESTMNRLRKAIIILQIILQFPIKVFTFYGRKK